MFIIRDKIKAIGSFLSKVVSDIYLFTKENTKALVLVLFVIIVEVIYLPFSEIAHSPNFSYGDCLYYFTAQLGYASLLPSIFLYLSEVKINSKGLYLGLIVYNISEVIQEANVLFKWDVIILNKLTHCSSDEMQIIFIIFTVALTFYGYKICNKS